MPTQGAAEEAARTHYEAQGINPLIDQREDCQAIQGRTRALNEKQEEALMPRLLEVLRHSGLIVKDLSKTRVRADVLVRTQGMDEIDQMARNFISLDEMWIGLHIKTSCFGEWRMAPRKTSVNGDKR